MAGDAPVSSVKAVSVSSAAFPAVSVKVIVHAYTPSPLEAESVTVFDPDDDSVAAELSPHPVVPPTAMVPASLVEINSETDFVARNDAFARLARVSRSRRTRRW